MAIRGVGDKFHTYYYNGTIRTCRWLDKLDIEFSDNVSVGLDQSSTRTGVCIEDDIGNLFISELAREDMAVPHYNQSLQTFLARTLDPLDVEFFIHETHGPHIAPLESVINTVTKSLKEFSKKFNRRDMETAGCLPPVWRSGFLGGDEEYVGRYNRDDVKLACVQKAISLVPDLAAYVEHSGSDYDGFEAFGIVRGFKALNFTSGGVRVVNKTMPVSHMRHPEYMLFKINNNDIVDAVNKLRKGKTAKECPFVMSNTKIQLEESINRITGLYKECIMLYVPGLEYCRLILEYGEPLDINTESFLVYVRR